MIIDTNKTYQELVVQADLKANQARSVRENAQYAESNAYHEEINMARQLELEARELNLAAARKLNEQERRAA